MVTNTKREHYEDLMERMSDAHANEVYFEASWFAYTILEDRLLSALKQSGGDKYNNNKPIRMLGKKIEVLQQRKKKDKLLRSYFTDGLVDNIHRWKEERNDLMHAMADGTKTMMEIDKAAFLLSESAKALVKDVCAAARLLKKNRHQVPLSP